MIAIITIENIEVKIVIKGKLEENKGIIKKEDFTEGKWVKERTI